MGCLIALASPFAVYGLSLLFIGDSKVLGSDAQTNAIVVTIVWVVFLVTAYGKS